MITTQIDRFTQGKITGQHLTKLQRQLLEKHLQTERVAEYRQRIEIMLLTDDGQTQTQICRSLGCSPLTARHWIFMAKSGYAHHWQEQPIGRPKTVNEDYLKRLQELVSKSPKDFGYSFPRWTGQWLGKHLFQEFNIEVSSRHINRLIKEINLGAKDVRQQRQVGSNELVINDLSQTDNTSC